MKRPSLTPADLEEVDRLLALAGECGNTMGADPFLAPMKIGHIRKNSVYRAATILGVMPEDTEAEPSPAEALQEAMKTPHIPSDLLVGKEPPNTEMMFSGSCTSCGQIIPNCACNRPAPLLKDAIGKEMPPPPVHVMDEDEFMNLPGLPEEPLPGVSR